jgi:type II secretory pathway component PulM
LNALRSGAATVQRDAPNAGQAAAAPSATASGATLNARIINMIDPAMVGDYLATPEGEQVIVNVMHRNADTFKAFQNG